MTTEPNEPALNPTALRARKSSHGHASRKKRSREHVTWDAMIQRCRNVNHPAFHHYGERGITVCERWTFFSNFLSDMGSKPPGMTLERIDNDGNYEPSNCRWATHTENCRNRRTCRVIIHEGERLTITEWAKRAGCSPAAFSSRIARGWSISAAISRPAVVQLKKRK